MMRNSPNKINTMEDIYKIFTLSNEEFIQWLSNNRFILNINEHYISSICGSETNRRYGKSYPDGAIFMCKGIHWHKSSIRSKTILEKSKFDLRTAISLYASWALDMTPSMAKMDRPSLPEIDTIHYYFKRFRNLSEIAYYNDLTHNPLGGLWGNVQIDETMITKAKYNVGRNLSLSQMWFFGGIDSVTGRVSIDLVEKSNANTLFPIIEKYVEINTHIHTDQWAAYRNLNEQGFFHYTVNHKYNFVHPDTHVHTQMIECVWHHLKQWLRSKNITNRDSYQLHIHEWCFRKNLVNYFDDLWNLIRFQHIN